MKKRKLPTIHAELIAALVAPSVGRVPSVDEIEAAFVKVLAPRDLMPLTELAKYYQMNYQSIRKRIVAAGIQPQKIGGKSGREFYYSVAEVAKCLT